MAPSSRQTKDVTMADASLHTINNNDTAIKKKTVTEKKKKIVVIEGVATAGDRRRWKNNPQQHITQLRECFDDGSRDWQVLIVVADSYSRKSHYLPKYLAQDETRGKRIACAYFSTMAAAVASKCPPTNIISGVSVRGRRDYMSVDCLLQMIAAGDPDLSSYSAVYVDAAHHRTVATDVLLGSLIPELVRRSPTKVSTSETFRLVLGVTPSAAYQAKKLSAFFGGHCITETCVLANYNPADDPPREILHTEPGASTPGEDLVEAALSAALELHTSEETNGSILLFLGVGSVEKACHSVQQRIACSSNPKDKTLRVIPLYTGDDWEVDCSLPEEPGRCLYILSPEVPDASPRLHGVCYVIDPGIGRGGRRISQQSACDRASHLRSANSRFGVPTCFRLYTEREYLGEMPPTTTPAILTCSVQELSVVLGKMKHLEITDPSTFNFIDPPTTEALASAMKLMEPLTLPDLSRLSLAMEPDLALPDLSRLSLAP